MDLIRAAAWLHIVLAILLMGFALFWFFMEIALRKRHAPARAAELLQALTRARWPHVGVPPALRIPLPWLSWLVIAAIVVTGLPGALAREAPGGLGTAHLAFEHLLLLHGIPGGAALFNVYFVVRLTVSLVGGAIWALSGARGFLIVPRP